MCESAADTLLILMTLSFETIARSALDLWSASPATADHTPRSDAERFLPLAGAKGVNLHCIDMTQDDPRDFSLVSVLEQTSLRRQGVTRLCDYPDQSFIKQHVAAPFSAVRDSSQPVVETVQARMLDQYLVYDRLILPQKVSRGRSAWAVSLVIPRLVLPAVSLSKPLTRRDNDVLSLIIEGLTAKQIAARLGLSQRTVEHRTQHLKDKFGAATIPQMVAMAIGMKLAGPRPGG